MLAFVIQENVQYHIGERNKKLQNHTVNTKIKQNKKRGKHN